LSKTNPLLTRFIVPLVNGAPLIFEGLSNSSFAPLHL
jgi:hypothetical protein